LTGNEKTHKIPAPQNCIFPCDLRKNLVAFGRHRTMSKETKDFIEMKGIVEELLPSANFRIKLENGQMIVGYLAGKMRKFRIRILPGDEVKVEISPYDLTKGRVVYRF